MPTRFTFVIDTDDDHIHLTEIEPTLEEMGGKQIWKEQVVEHEALDPETAPLCQRPPEGWHCTKPAGHDGPCPTVPDSMRQEIVYVAECQIHGLHGERTECFICGGPVKQVALARVPG